MGRGGWVCGSGAAVALLVRCLRRCGIGIWVRGRVPVDNMRERSAIEPVAAFSMSHPAVPALYMALTLGLTMFSMQPVLIALSLAGGLAYGSSQAGWHTALRPAGLLAH